MNVSKQCFCLCANGPCMRPGQIVNLIEITHVCASTLQLFKKKYTELNTFADTDRHQRTHSETEKQIKFTLHFLITNFRFVFSSVRIAFAFENWPRPSSMCFGKLLVHSRNKHRRHHTVDSGPRLLSRCKAYECKYIYVLFEGHSLCRAAECGVHVPTVIIIIRERREKNEVFHISHGSFQIKQGSNCWHVPFS